MFATRSILPAVILASLAAMVICLATVATAAGDNALPEEAQGLFGALQAVPDAALGAADVTLGRALFWDTRVSADSKTACASCHLPEDWSADRRRFSPDAKGKTKRLPLSPPF